MSYKNDAQQRAYQAAWYQRNKVRRLAAAKRQREEVYAFVNMYRRECSICGYSKCKAALEFHHPDGDKTLAVSEIIRLSGSKERLLAEIAKCVVLCANCHAEHHNKPENHVVCAAQTAPKR